MNAAQLTAVAALAALTAGCGGERGPATTRTVDSAGIQVTVAAGPGTWTDGEQWTVVPALSVGEAQGDSALVFGRIGDVALDGAGRLHVLDQQAAEVRVFDRDGAPLHVYGGAGRGPGELSRYTNAVLVGERDTTFVPDYTQARINVYGPDGEPAEPIGVPPRPGGQSWILDGGTFLFRGVTVSRDAQGVFQTWDGLLRVDRAGTTLDTLFVFDYEPTPLGTRAALRIPLIVNQPFWTRMPDGRVAWSSLDQDRVFIHDVTGSLTAIVTREAWVSRPPSDEEIGTLTELLRTKLEMLSGDASAADSPNVDPPARLPAITGVQAGPDGTLWVQRMGAIDRVHPMAINAPDRSSWLGAPVWDVFDASGAYLGEVTLPEGVQVTRITDTDVVGIARDAMDVERAIVLTLNRP